VNLPITGDDMAVLDPTSRMLRNGAHDLRHARGSEAVPACVGHAGPPIQLLTAEIPVFDVAGLELEKRPLQRKPWPRRNGGKREPASARSRWQANEDDVLARGRDALLTASLVVTRQAECASRVGH